MHISARLAVFTAVTFAFVACGSSTDTGAADGESGALGGQAGAVSSGGKAGAGAAGGSAGSAGAAAGTAGNAGTGGSPAGNGGVAGSGGSSGAAGAAGASGVAGASGASSGGKAGAAGASGTGGVAGTAGASSGAAGASSGAAGAAGGKAGASGSAGAGGSGCVPTQAIETLCNNIDDDCNGKVDDVDAAGDGVCDCLRIGIVGVPGANASSNFVSWLQGLGTTVNRVNTAAGDTFDAPLLAKYDVVIFDRLVRAYSAGEADALKGWVEQGGGFVTMTGYANNPNPDFLPNPLLAPFGLSYGGALSSATANIFVPHPVTNGVTSVTFLGGYVVTPTVVAGGTSTLIASNADGHIGYVHERGKGRGVVWGDEWIEFDSEWSTMPQIQKFWVNIMGWVGPQGRCVVPKP